ncbi:MAG: 2-amino-4-hydroxy-6-hydroxymethyldihydropteridine diphosphokinase [Pseudomonadota bacterium]
MSPASGVRVFIGLGSNLDNPIAQLTRALAALKRLPHSRVRAQSSLYRSVPMGPADQPDYVNAVVEIETELEALDLLSRLQQIEQNQGRTRTGLRWGPRTLDLDLLLYGDQIIDLPTLQVPHPGVAERNFVLYPLHEIAPTVKVPGLGAIGTLLKRCPDKGLVKLAGENEWR